MKKAFFLITVCIASLFFTGCVSALVDLAYKSSVTSDLKKTEDEFTPENSVLIYTGNFSDFTLYQQNPKIGYDFYTSYGFADWTNTIGLAGPVKVGSEFAVSRYTYTSLNTIYTNYVNGIQGVDFAVTKPGLYYLDFWDENHSLELKATKTLLSYAKGTVWENAVKERIEELENEKK